MALQKLYRVEAVQRFQGQLMMNVFHIATTVATHVAADVANNFSTYIMPALMQPQTVYVTWEVLRITCLNPLYPEFMIYDLQDQNPQRDELYMPQPCCIKFTGRNIGRHRGTIGGFYLGGLISSLFDRNGRVSDEGNVVFSSLRNSILQYVGIDGVTLFRIGTYGRETHKQLPNESPLTFFSPYITLNYNRYFTSQRKRVPGVGI
jgi:hypothetical protein